MKDKTEEILEKMGWKAVKGGFFDRMEFEELKSQMLANQRLSIVELRRLFYITDFKEMYKFILEVYGLQEGLKKLSLEKHRQEFLDQSVSDKINSLQEETKIESFNKSINQEDLTTNPELVNQGVRVDDEINLKTVSPEEMSHILIEMLKDNGFDPRDSETILSHARDLIGFRNKFEKSDSNYE